MDNIFFIFYVIMFIYEIERKKENKSWMLDFEKENILKFFKMNVCKIFLIKII